MRKTLEMIAVIVAVTSIITVAVLLSVGPRGDRALPPAGAQPEASTQEGRPNQEHIVTTDPEAPGHRF
jgi:predicted small lipoprotein YifL